jgi:hypothetical protein
MSIHSGHPEKYDKIKTKLELGEDKISQIKQNNIWMPLD